MNNTEAKVKPIIINVEGKILGRISTEICDILRGKNKATFYPNIVCGEKVIVYNAEKIKVTGNKMDDKQYVRHSGWPGSLKIRTLRQVMDKNPTQVIRDSVSGMLPKNKLRKIWLSNLTIYVGKPANIDLLE